MRGITLQGGHEQLDASSYGGAIDITQGPHQRIHLEDVLVTQNEAGVGGAISIRNGTPSQPSAVTVVLAANTSVNNNLGWTGGGGIYCRDATLLTESAPVSILLNRAGDLSDDNPSAYGGGLYLVNCRAEIAVGLFAAISDVGFGVNQYLPIAVAELQREPGSTIAISQPETHLHPSAQAAVGEHIASMVAGRKFRYVIETHSEYMVNRIRRLIAKGTLKPTDVTAYYVTQSTAGISSAEKMTFLPDGTIQGAPSEFFETYQVDVLGIAMRS